MDKNLTRFLCGIILAALSCSVSAQQPSGGRENLLTNGSFEEGKASWDFGAWGSKGTATVDEQVKRDEKASIRIDNLAGDDSFLKQTVTVKPKTRYRLTGHIKTKDIVAKGTGATLSLQGGFEGTKSISGTKGWTKVSFEFDSGPLDKVTVGPRLGHHSQPAMGTAWFDEISLVEIGPSRNR